MGKASVDFCRQLTHRFGNSALPPIKSCLSNSLVIDGSGTIRYAWVAPNPGVEPNYDEVKAAVAALA